MNVLDSEVIEGRLAAAGYETAESPEDADVVILNTCSVRQHAENKVFSFLGRLGELKNRRPDMTIVVAGCVAQRLGADLRKRYPQVDLVVGTSRLGDLLGLVDELKGAGRGGDGVHVEEETPGYPERAVSHRASRFQAFVSVMRGCDNFCAYCIVPYVRGRQASRPAGEVVDEVKALVDDGVREVTLLGQNATAYGHDRGETGSLVRLLAELQRIEGLEWVKFVTSHPRDTGEDVFRAMRDLPKMCKYLHLPAQSGSDHILTLMRRGYSRQEYLDKVSLLGEIAGEVSIASDFIVGFPGETESDFEDTMDLVRRVAYKNSFIFKYSPREGTAAARLADDVPVVEKKRRNNALLAVQHVQSLAHNRLFLGRTVKVLVDGPSKKDSARLAARTEGEEIVIFDGPAGLGSTTLGPTALAGQFVMVEITGATAITLSGKLVVDGG
jgi:tRNA-2-methylthio-N6-dimethylallyladenosine synthase